jgi:hydrogenase maturation protein HypF
MTGRIRRWRISSSVAHAPRDYGDPRSRRFHAETIACPACGRASAIRSTRSRRRCATGGSSRSKGIGGFHLIVRCDQRGRGRNVCASASIAPQDRSPSWSRTTRPLALRQADLAERDLLGRSARPIVLVRKGSGLAPSVAPGLSRVGVMLPSAPVHHLLFQALSSGRRGPKAPCALVVTSANIAGEPLVIDNAVRDEGPGRHRRHDRDARSPILSAPTTRSWPSSTALRPSFGDRAGLCPNPSISARTARRCSPSARI